MGCARSSSAGVKAVSQTPQVIAPAATAVNSEAHLLPSGGGSADCECAEFV